MSEYSSQYDLAVISARSTDSNIELWGRCKTGESIFLQIEGLKPYIEVTYKGMEEPSDIDKRLEGLRERDDVVEVHDIGEKWTESGNKKMWKVIMNGSQHNNRTVFRKENGDNWKFYNADFNHEKRLFYDLDLGTHISVNCKLINNPDYPVDIYAKTDIHNLKQTDAFQAPFIIASFDLETSIDDNRILCAAVIIDQLDTSGQRKNIPEEYTFVGTEIEIMNGMTDLIRVKDPDIITGYNIDNFDIPRLKERLDYLTEKNDTKRRSELFGWARRNENEWGLIPYKPPNAKKWTIMGRCFVDAWWQARMVLRPKRETLSYVSQLLFPEREDLRKLEIDASKMDEEWKNRPEEVLEYCKRDALLPWEILDELKIIQGRESLAAVSKTPLDVVINGTTSNWIDSLVIRLADRSSVAVPMTKRYDRSDQIAGGYVHEVEPGVYPWVAVLDFKSMYPSIMINNNICRTTMIEDANTQLMCHESPDGIKYLQKSEREGLVPKLLVDLMSQRDFHKSEMKKAEQEGDKSKQRFHDGMQYAVKILMNSFYGVFASVFYRFTHKNIGSSITAWARHNITEIIRQLEEEGQNVVYSDTDSIFVSVPMEINAPTKRPDVESETKEFDGAKEELVRFGKELADRFTEDAAELEFETGLSAFFSHGAKKRYVGRMIWPKEEMIIRGYETRRSDSFTLLTNTMTSMFEYILDGNQESAIKEVIDLIKEVKKGNADVEDLVISRSCKGKVLKDGTVDFNEVYSNPDGLPFVKAAKERIKLGLEFTSGMKVAYVVTKTSGSTQEVEPWLVEDGGEPVSNYDVDYYSKRLAKALGRITEAFGWSESELLSGTRQTTLFSF
ncbi:MAG: DNA polymerase II [Methanobacteriota archaeon]|nr:MAG: DNA polymerase II [Euryarchaeota archaeon]